jgi:hypothetical protein
MKKKFVRVLAVVVALFAVLVFVYPDDLSDEIGCTQTGILAESSNTVPAHRNQQIVDSAPLIASTQRTYSASSQLPTSPALLCLSACVLRC